MTFVKTARSPSPCDATSPIEERRRQLSAAHYNTNLLPHHAIRTDMLTDSWAEREYPATREPRLTVNRLETFIHELYGCGQLLSVVQGRIAEAILAAVFARPGARILTNTLFPTAQFHVTSRGAQVLEISAHEQSSGFDPEFQGNVDPDLLTRHLREPVACVWLEACANGAFGAPLSLENLRTIHACCAARELPLILDGTRLLENVLLYARHHSTDPRQTLKDYCACADVLLLSGTKDFCVTRGGYIGAHDSALFTPIADVALAFGAALDKSGPVSGRLPEDPFEPARARLALVNGLYSELQATGVLASSHSGGHAVFIDVCRAVPLLADDPCAVPAFLNALYLRCGARGGQHMYTAQQETANRRIVRLAIPVAYDNGAELRVIAQSIRELIADPLSIEPLKIVARPPGLTAQFCTQYAPR